MGVWGADGVPIEQRGTHTGYVALLQVLATAAWSMGPALHWPALRLCTFFSFSRSILPSLTFFYNLSLFAGQYLVLEGIPLRISWPLDMLAEYVLRAKECDQGAAKLDSLVGLGVFFARYEVGGGYGRVW